MSADQAMPTRRGEEPASPRQVRVSAIATLVVLTALAAAALVIDHFVFFAVGAGAGYSLSGSV